MIPCGYIVRRPTAEDAPAITACIVSFERAVFSEADFSVAELEEEWGRPRFDMESDAWIVLDPSGAVAGYASVWDEVPRQDFFCDAVVHPDHWSRSVGGLLIDLMEERAADYLGFGNGPLLLHNVVAGPDSSAQRLLEGRGYERVRTFLRMVIDLGAPRPLVPAPPGIAIVSLRRGFDERAFYDTMKASFLLDFRVGEFHPYDEWAQRMALWDFDPSLWWLAWDHEHPVAILESRPLEDGDGWIKNVAVRPTHRRRGIAAALLARCFDELGGRGAKKVSLGVDSSNLTGAAVLYERAGMTSERSYHFYRKELPG
ncbi:MAG: GNAT family N-acetyltransferase [Actinomycetota bacterium]|nr:GNAT family N-acetyltransferase [Actinomycetota bacterium]